MAKPLLPSELTGRYRPRKTKSKPRKDTLNDPPITDPSKCNAVKKTGKRCGNPKGFKTDHLGFGRCFLHGGAAPNGKKRAMVERAEREVMTYGLPIDIDPHTALIQEVQRTAGHVAWLEQRVRELSPESLVWGATSEKRKGAEFRPDVLGGSGEEAPSTEGGNGNGHDIIPAKGGRKAFVPGIEEVERHYAAQRNIILSLYQSERTHLVDVCRAAIACGIAERQVRIAEAQAMVIVRVVTGVMKSLGADVDDQKVMMLVSERLLEASSQAFIETSATRVS